MQSSSGFVRKRLLVLLARISCRSFRSKKTRKTRMLIANNSRCIIGGDKMGKETLLKIGQIGCTALAGFLGICLTQLSIDKAVDKKVKALESTDSKEDED